MKQIYPDLWQSKIYSSGMLNTHAYLLTRPEENILFYNIGNRKDLDKIVELGGIKYQLLTHRDEVGASLKRIKNEFSPMMGIGKLEALYAKKHVTTDIEFDNQDTEIENVKVFFTPGHTNGSICYYYESPYGKSYLFSGDTIFKWDGRWSTFVIKGFGGTNQDMMTSLQKLRKLKPDVVLSSGFLGNEPYGEVTNKEWVEVIDKLIDQKK